MERMINSDEAQMLSDRIENTVAVVDFLGAASTCLAAREEPMSDNELYGMLLTFQHVANNMRQCMNFVLQGKPLL